MTDQEILDSGPEGWTHYDGKTYFRFEMYEHGQAYLILKNGIWQRGLPAYPVFSCRLRADIERIVELEKSLEKRDLEQQAKGLDMASEMCDSHNWSWDGDCGFWGAIDNKANELRKKAEDL